MMRLIEQARKPVKGPLPGAAKNSQQYRGNRHNPQTEVEVWLHGAGIPQNVTRRHATAYASPLTVCIGFDCDEILTLTGEKLCLRFEDKKRGQLVLGEVTLRLSEIVETDEQRLGLFDVCGSRNYTVPRRLRWAYELRQAYLHWKNGSVPNEQTSELDSQAMRVLLLCTRSVTLVSLCGGNPEDILPLNRMGGMKDAPHVPAPAADRHTLPMGGLYVEGDVQRDAV